ncbi:MAG: flavodoxin, partial [Abditibacteriota bacterium]|nr:flavodoxin [Abditibacteriota bacterium]
MRKSILIMAAAIAAVLSACACLFAAQESVSPDIAAVSGSGPAKAVVVYFSVTGNTKTVADYIARAAGADICEIVPRQYYLEPDLDYRTPGCRSSVEYKDPLSRPEIRNELTKLGEYRVIYLGFPIWYGTAPKILFTFLESVDLKDKTVIPFCTSGSSSIDKALEDLLP